jgi:hypothetical protein
MNWLCIKLYYNQQHQNSIFLKIYRFIENGELKSIPFFYRLGFENINYIRLSFYCDIESRIKIAKLIEELRKNDIFLKSFNSKEVEYIMEFNLTSSENISNAFSIYSSKSALKLMFYENTIYSYFNLLLTTLIFNYITINLFLGIQSQEFFNSYVNVESPSNYDLTFSKRFEINSITEGFESINLKNILELAKNDQLDICDDLQDYLSICRENKIKFSELFRSFNKVSQIPINTEKDILKRLLEEIISRNANRMGIPEGHSLLCMKLTAIALN